MLTDIPLAIVAGLTAGISFTILNAIFMTLGRGERVKAEDWHRQLSTMIAVNQVRNQQGQHPIYTEKAIEEHYHNK